VLTSDGGRIMDDGTIARLADDLYYVTTTSTGADSVTAWFEWWNAVWHMDVESRRHGTAAVNLAGPQAARRGAPRPDVSTRHLVPRREAGRSRACLVLRIGFVGELGYELHCPSPAGTSGHARRSRRAAVELEPQRILPREEHILVGQDTDRVEPPRPGWTGCRLTRTTSSAVGAELVPSAGARAARRFRREPGVPLEAARS
jgi:sarcosine oxidase subunit alpha